MSGLGSILFFLISGAVFTALIWSTLEFFRAEENPLEDRLDDLGSQAMVATGARPTRFKTSGSGFDRFLYVISLAPGAADWMRGSERLLRRAGFRSKQALAIYVFLFLIFVTLVLTGMGLLQRGNARLRDAAVAELDVANALRRDRIEDLPQPARLREGSGRDEDRPGHACMRPSSRPATSKSTASSMSMLRSRGMTYPSAGVAKSGPSTGTASPRMTSTAPFGR